MRLPTRHSESNLLITYLVLRMLQLYACSNVGTAAVSGDHYDNTQGVWHDITRNLDRHTNAAAGWRSGRCERSEMQNAANLLQ